MTDLNSPPFPAPPGMLFGVHGYAFKHEEFHAAQNSFKKDKKAHLKRVLEAEVFSPADLSVLSDDDDESTSGIVRCYELGPKRALPTGWVYDATTLKLRTLVWTKYDAWFEQHVAKTFSKSLLILSKPREETMEEDMKAWYQKKWPCKPF